eukprot:PhM_4_TR9789/c1_g1_i1/m.40551
MSNQPAINYQQQQQQNILFAVSALTKVELGAKTSSFVSNKNNVSRHASMESLPTLVPAPPSMPNINNTNKYINKKKRKGAGGRSGVMSLPELSASLKLKGIISDNDVFETTTTTTTTRRAPSPSPPRHDTRRCPSRQTGAIVINNYGDGVNPYIRKKSDYVLTSQDVGRVQLPRLRKYAGMERIINTCQQSIARREETRERHVRSGLGKVGAFNAVAKFKSRLNNVEMKTEEGYRRAIKDIRKAQALIQQIRDVGDQLAAPPPGPPSPPDFWYGYYAHLRLVIEHNTSGNDGLGLTIDEAWERACVPPYNPKNVRLNLPYLRRKERDYVKNWSVAELCAALRPDIESVVFVGFESRYNEEAASSRFDPAYAQYPYAHALPIVESFVRRFGVVSESSRISRKAFALGMPTAGRGDDFDADYLFDYICENLGSDDDEFVTVHGYATLFPPRKR